MHSDLVGFAISLNSTTKTEEREGTVAAHEVSEQRHLDLHPRFQIKNAALKFAGSSRRVARRGAEECCVSVS